MLSPIFPHKRLSIAVLILFVLAQMIVPAWADNIVIEQNYQLFPNLHVPTYSWAKADMQPKAIIVGLHGGCLYGGAYQTLAEQLAKKNYLLVSFDMRGYGRWYHCDYGTKKDRTFNYQKSYSDLKTLLLQIHHKYPNVPVYCIGESLGANVGLLLAGKNPELIQGLVLCSPFQAPKLFFYPRMLMDFVHMCVAPYLKLNLSPYLERRLAWNKYLAMAQVTDPMSRNEQTVFELYRSHKVIVKGKKYAKRIPTEMPVLFIVGEIDKLCNTKANFKLYNTIPSKNKSYVIVAEQGHLIVETPHVKPQVIDMISSWINDNQPAMQTASRQ